MEDAISWLPQGVGRIRFLAAVEVSTLFLRSLLMKGSHRFLGPPVLPVYVALSIGVPNGMAGFFKASKS